MDGPKYENMHPTAAKQAAENTAKLMGEGAKIGEHGNVEVTDAQWEAAQVGMKAEQILKQVKGLRAVAGQNLEAVAKELEKYGGEGKALAQIVLDKYV